MKKKKSSSSTMRTRMDLSPRRCRRRVKKYACYGLYDSPLTLLVRF